MGIAVRAEVPPRNGNGKTLQDPKVRFPVHTSAGRASGEPGGIPSSRPDTHDPKITLLRSVPLFADLASAELHLIADRSTWRDYRRRQAIHFPGDPAEAVFVVQQGRVKISRLSEDGKVATLNLVGPGEPFGEECLLDAPVRETIAEALEPVQVLRIPREELAPALNAQHAFALAVARLMSGRRRAADRRRDPAGPVAGAPGPRGAYRVHPGDHDTHLEPVQAWRPAADRSLPDSDPGSRGAGSYRLNTGVGG